MNNDDSFPTPDALADAPELASLATLDHALTIVTSALLAAHPELTTAEDLCDQEGEDLCDQEGIAIQTWFADAIIREAGLLQHTIARYRRLVRQCRQRTEASCDNNGF
jgi:hypothetical protein